MAELRKQITHALLHERGDIHANTLSAELMDEMLRTVDPGRSDEEVLTRVYIHIHMYIYAYTPGAITALRSGEIYGPRSHIHI